MIERAAWTNEPSSKWPDVQFHGNCHQSRTPHEWSRWPAQSTGIVSSPIVTVPVTHDEISYRVVIAYGNASDRLAHSRSSAHRHRRAVEPVERLRGVGELDARPPRSRTRKRRNGSDHESSTLVDPADGASAASPSGHGSSWSTTSTSGRSAPTSAIHHHDSPRFG